jgi:CBS domain-containing protein
MCTVYARHGSRDATAIEGGAPMPTRYKRTVADHVPLRDVMSSELICARPDLEIGKVVSLLIEHRVGCIPVVDERRRALGVITKFDVVEQLSLSLRAPDLLPTDLVARTAEDLMIPIALMLDERATVAHAVAMMTAENTHHVLVVRDGELVGVVSAKDIVTWIAANDGLTPVRDDDCQIPPAWRSLEG